MKEFVAYIVKNLVDHPDQVKINEIGGTQTLIIELSVEKSDIGKIIGKKGKTINAIRTLLMSVASRNGIRVNLEILGFNVRDHLVLGGGEERNNHSNRFAIVRANDFLSFRAFDSECHVHIHAIACFRHLQI